MTATVRTNRWAGVDAVPWAAVAVGLLAREPAVLLLAAVGAAFSVYARVGTAPGPELVVRRELDDRSLAPGEEFTVRLTVENRGDQALPDLRLVDGVPAALGVAEGSPHLGTALRAGESLTHSYRLRAERGTHEFDPVTVVCRSFNGSFERELTREVGTSLTCRPRMRGTVDPPLRGQLAQPGGQLSTDSGGSGVEFFGVREYRAGDRPGHIDWARRARTGELATLQFREQRRATVVCWLDARSAAYVRAPAEDGAGTAADAAGAHAVEHGIRAAAEAFAGLLDAGNRAGVAAIGAEFVWLGPGAGDAHRRRARELLSTHPVLSPSPARSRLGGDGLALSTGIGTETASQLQRLDASLAADAQLLFFSPLADDGAVSAAGWVAAAGYPVTVVSPDVTGGDTAGARLGTLKRRERIRRLLAADVRVVDWDPIEPLGAALERARRAWQ